MSPVTHIYIHTLLHSHLLIHTHPWYLLASDTFLRHLAHSKTRITSLCQMLPLCKDYKLTQTNTHIQCSCLSLHIQKTNIYSIYMCGYIWMFFVYILNKGRNRLEIASAFDWICWKRQIFNNNICNVKGYIASVICI